MKVALFYHSAARGGAELSMTAGLRALVDLGHDVVVILPGPGPIEDELREAGVARSAILHTRMHLWSSRRGGGLVGMARLVQCILDAPRVLALLRATTPDRVVVNTGVLPTPLFVARALGMETVVIVREALVSNPGLRSVLPRRWLAAALRRAASRVVAVSHFVADQVSADLVVPPHVPCPPEASVDRRAADTPDLRVVMIGAISPDKGQLAALEAVKASRDVGADVRLEVVGGGVSRDVRRLQRQVERLAARPFAILHQPVTDVADVFARADLLIAPSRHEGFGRIALEAMGHGVPVLAYDSGGNREALALGGGVLVEPTVGELTASIVALANDRARLTALGREARQAAGRWEEARGDIRLAEAVVGAS